MDEQLRYEPWNELPLPDEQLAWEDMKRRLEEEDDTTLIPWWKTGCAPWALGLLLLITISLAWWWYHHTHAATKKDTTKVVRTGTSSSSTTTSPTINAGKHSTATVTTHNSSTVSTSKIVKDSLNSYATTSIDASKSNTAAKLATGRKVVANSPLVTTQKRRHLNHTSTKGKSKITTASGGKQQSYNIPASSITIRTTPATQLPASTHTDTVKVIAKQDATPITLTDSTRKDTVAKKTKQPDTVITKKQPDSSTKKIKQWAYSAGIGLYQQLPLSGQSTVPYSTSGRQHSFSDYVPSVYIRATRKNRWFIEGEFRYGAPQNNKQTRYQVKQIKDQLPLDTSNFSQYSYTLKRTFYHQVPLSFNYYVLPNLSVGSGLIWNHFVSAVSQTEFVRGNEFFGIYDTTRRVTITRQTTDSSGAFKKSYLQAQFSLQYQWRRWSIGGKYILGLQPFIEYTLPGQPTRREKNQSFQLYLHFRVWSSQPAKKKRR
jgi:hypothetical protein